MFGMDFVFSISSFETIVLAIIFLGVFVYTFMVLRHNTDTLHHVDAMAGDEGED